MAVDLQAMYQGRFDKEYNLGRNGRKIGMLFQLCSLSQFLLLYHRLWEIGAYWPNDASVWTHRVGNFPVSFPYFALRRSAKYGNDTGNCQLPNAVMKMG